MSEQVVAHFVGGPWDGKTVVLREPRDYFEVAIMPPLPSYLPSDEDVATCPTFERFTYVREWVPGNSHVFIPRDWTKDPTNTAGEKLIHALLRGYVGRL